MSIFEASKTPFQESMDPTPGFSNTVHGFESTPNAIPGESTLPPYEFTLGDTHDTLPADDAPGVVPEVEPLKKIMTRLVELPLHRPEDN